MARRLQHLLFFALVAGILLALWSWSGDGPEQVPDGATSNPAPKVDASPALGSGSQPAPAPPAAPGRIEPQSRSDAHPAAASIPGFLPDEAFDTLVLIVRNGPFPYRQDGSTFQNRERRLPQQPRGYYREYTVKTPGSRDRGARRIVTGGEVGDAPPQEYYYTADHYRSFRRFDFDPDQVRP